jgi:hypothetical protein
MATYSERVRRKLADLKTILGVWMLLVPKGLYIISKKPLPLVGAFLASKQEALHSIRLRQRRVREH